MSLKDLYRRAQDDIGEMLSSGRTSSRYGFEKLTSVSNRLSAPDAANLIAGVGRWGNYGVDIGMHQEQYRHFAGSVYSIVTLIANRIAGQPINHAQIIKNQKQISPRERAVKSFLPQSLKSRHHNIRILQDSVVLDVFRDPNPIQVRHSLCWLTVVSKEITAKSHWWMTYGDDGKPEIWFIPSHWIYPEHTDKRLFDRWKVRPGGSGQTFELAREEVCYFYDPDPSDPLGAYSPLSAMAKTIMNDESIEETQRRAFLNAVAPSVAVMVGQSPEASGAGVAGVQSPVLTRPQRKQLRSIFMEEYRGVLNSGMPLIMDGFIRDVKILNQPPKEFDFLNSGNFTSNRLTKGWSVNPVSQGQMEGISRASSAVADTHLCKNCINPRLELMSEVATRAIPAFYTKRQDEIIFWEPAKSQDEELELTRENQMMDRAAMTRNEQRERQGLPRIKGGDSVYLSGELIEIEFEDQDAPEKKIAPPSHKAIKCPFGTLAGKLGIKGVAQQNEKVQARYEKQMHDALTSTFSALSQGIEKKLERIDQAHLTPRFVASVVIEKGVWEARLRETLLPIIKEAMIAGATVEWSMSRDIRSEAPKFKSSLPGSIIARIRKQVQVLSDSSMWARMVDTTIKKIKRTVRDALRSGVNVALSVGIAIGSPEAILDRSAEIAQVESVAAFSAGQAFTYKTLAAHGKVMGRTWITRRDAKVRDTHAQAEGQTVYGDQKFMVGGYEAEYPGDPKLPPQERCNCRCTVVSIG